MQMDQKRMKVTLLIRDKKVLLNNIYSIQIITNIKFCDEYFFFIEDENDSDEEEEDDEKNTLPSVRKSMSLSNSRRASRLEKMQRESSLSLTKGLWKSSTESVRIACQTCTESNATVDSAKEKDICLHKPILHISNGDEADEKGKETAV